MLQRKNSNVIWGLSISTYCHINNKSNKVYFQQNHIFLYGVVYDVLIIIIFLHTYNTKFIFQVVSMLYLSENIQTDKTYETININNRTHHTVTTKLSAPQYTISLLLQFVELSFGLRYIIYNTTAHYTRNAKLSPFIFELITSTILLSVCFHCITDLRRVYKNP